MNENSHKENFKNNQLSVNEIECKNQDTEANMSTNNASEKYKKEYEQFNAQLLAYKTISSKNHNNDNNHHKITTTTFSSSSTTHNSNNRQFSCKSAFESDPDVISFHNLKENKIMNYISPITQKYLSYKNVHQPISLQTSTANESKIKYVEQVEIEQNKFENDYLNIFTLKIRNNQNQNSNLSNPTPPATLPFQPKINYLPPPSPSKPQQNNKKDELNKKSLICKEIPIQVIVEKKSDSITEQYEEVKNRSHSNKSSSSSITETLESTHIDSDYAKGPTFPTHVYGSSPINNFNNLNNHNSNCKISTSCSVGSGGIYSRTNPNNRNSYLTLNSHIDNNTSYVNEMVKKLREDYEKNGDVSSLNVQLDNLWLK